MEHGWDLLYNMKCKQVLWDGSVKRFLRIHSYRNFMVCQVIVHRLCATSEPEPIVNLKKSRSADTHEGKVWGKKGRATHLRLTKVEWSLLKESQDQL